MAWESWWEKTQESEKKKVFSILSFCRRYEFCSKEDFVFTHAIFLYDTGDVLVLTMVGKEKRQTVQAEWLDKEAPTPT